MICSEILLQGIRTQGGKDLPFYEKVLIAAGAGGLGGFVGNILSIYIHVSIYLSSISYLPVSIGFGDWHIDFLGPCRFTCHIVTYVIQKNFLPIT